ncbi:helix-turn-helix domain-containing protein [Streptomyces sp. NPDC006640]|uniref:helix-turn-helix domain-containing protein n=1 Tax=unclassified Streptomyces TaxID=2593676 RepID=UPI0036A8A8C1
MTQPPAPDWSTRLALAVAQEVRRHRQEQGLSAQQLADRCAQIGMPIQRSVLANLESGRRTTVTVAEVLVLAHALNVPPGVLMFPVGHEQESEVLPGSWVEPGSAVEWLAGRSFFAGEAADDFFETPLGFFRLHQDAATDLRRGILARDAAWNEVARLTVAHQEDERDYETYSAQAAEVRRQLTENSERVKAGAGYDLEISNRLSGEHRRLMDEVLRTQQGATQLRWARERAATAEVTVTSRESRLREIRKAMRDRELVPPLLPRALIYIDPDTVPFEDVPIRRDLPQSTESTHSLEDPEPPQELASGQVDSYFGDQERIRELLEQLEPRLAETIAKAVDEGIRRREQGGK